MTYEEFVKTKGIFYGSYKGRVTYSKYNRTNFTKMNISSVDKNRFGRLNARCTNEQGNTLYINHEYIMPETTALQIGDEIEHWNGKKYVFKNMLQNHEEISCLPVGEKKGRIWVRIGEIYKVNGKEVYKLNETLMDLLGIL